MGYTTLTREKALECRRTYVDFQRYFANEDPGERGEGGTEEIQFT